MHRRRSAVLGAAPAALLASWLAPLAARAQDLDPRLHTNVPIGINFLAAGYAYSEGNVLFDPSIALDNAEIEIDGPVVGYGRSLGLGPFSGKFDTAIGRVCLDGSADYQGEHATRNVCGVTDARARITVNFAGAPPLRRQEFAAYEQNWVFGASLQLGLPTGDYDSDRLVNIGANRVSSKLELGVSKDLGRWLFEISAGDTYFEDNTEFFGGRVRSQDPITSVQAHAVYAFSRGAWLALDGTRYHGGRTSSGNTVNPDFQSNSRFGITASVPINRSQSVKINASTGVSTRTGTDFDTVGAVWQFVWGGR